MRNIASPFVAAALLTLLSAGQVAAESTGDAGPQTATPAAAAPAAPAATSSAAPANSTAPAAAPAPAATTSAPSAAPSSSAAAKTTAPATLHRIRGGAHIEVHARDLRLADTQRDRLMRIAERYFKVTKRKLVITGGSRSAQRQAELMIAKLKKGEDFAKLYENRGAAVEISKLYKEGVAKRLSEKALIESLRKKIEAQMAAGNYVSKHLKAGAADVRSRDLKPADEKALRAAVAAEPGVSLVDERQSAEPHFHLGL